MQERSSALLIRKQILRDYNVDANSIIRSPGKFEGEPVFAPYFWDLVLTGFSDGDDGRVVTFHIPATDEECTEWPELAKWLGRKRTLRLVENDQGFVHCF